MQQKLIKAMIPEVIQPLYFREWLETVKIFGFLKLIPRISKLKTLLSVASGIKTSIKYK